MQVYIYFLICIALKAEYISGTMSDVGLTSTYANYNSAFKVAWERNFSGYYATLIKNIGKNHQAIVRYDVFDPNTKSAGDNVASVNDLKYSTLSLSC